MVARFAIDAGEPHRARGRVQAQHFGHVPVAVRHLLLQLAGGRVVDVQVAPVAALAPPQDLVAVRQVAPVDGVDAGLEPVLRVFAEDLVHRTGGHVGRAHPGLRVVARGRGERDRLAVLRPLHVFPAAEAADVVALRGACWSGAIFRRTIFVVGTSITTRSIIVTSLSPTSGYFQVSTRGCPTLVPTSVISPVLRWSCWKVAILDESGDHTRIALSSCTQPALLVA
jgi:hypothetical protein